MKTTSSAAFFAILLFCTHVTADLVNPSFELPDVADTGYADVDPGGWIVNETASFQVALFDRPDITAPDGTQFAVFNAGATPTGSSMFQTVSTIQNATYEVSFWTMANIPSRSSVQASVYDGAGVGGTLLATEASSLAGAFVLTQSTFSFTADSNTTTLEFLDTSSLTTGSDLFLDHVTLTVTSIPEPSSLLCIGAIALSGGLVRRRK
ncbi:MAG: PEP-CTERM sorting domain-containing protein [Planctomycetota bacterium]